MSFRVRFVLLALATVVFAGAAVASPDSLTLVSLNPPSGATIPGVSGGPMGPGNSIEATFDYNLVSKPQAQISVFTAGEAGNPPHVGVEVPAVVKKGKGRVTTRFSVRCDGRFPAPYLIAKIRYWMADVSVSPPHPLVEARRDVRYKFTCEQIGTQPGGPTGGKQLPDITSKKGITIGTVFIGWGGTGTLKASDAIQSSPNNACAFNATYDMVNVGPVATSPAFLNRLKVDATSVVAINSALALNAGETKNITTQPYLPFGTHRLSLALDDDHNVLESDETAPSNVKTVTYTLQGPCQLSAKLPGAVAPR